MKNWLIRKLGGYTELPTLAELVEKATIDEINYALGVKYSSHIYRHPTKRRYVTKGEC